MTKSIVTAMVRGRRNAASENARKTRPMISIRRFMVWIQNVAPKLIAVGRKSRGTNPWTSLADPKGTMRERMAK